MPRLFPRQCRKFFPFAHRDTRFARWHILPRALRLELRLTVRCGQQQINNTLGREQMRRLSLVALATCAVLASAGVHAQQPAPQPPEYGMPITLAQGDEGSRGGAGELRKARHSFGDQHRLDVRRSNLFREDGRRPIRIDRDFAAEGQDGRHLPPSDKGVRRSRRRRRTRHHRDCRCRALSPRPGVCRSCRAASWSARSASAARHAASSTKSCRKPASTR